MEITEIASLPSGAKITAMMAPRNSPMARNRPPLAGAVIALAKNSDSSEAKSSPRQASVVRRFGSSHTILIYFRTR
jgi:hypothetical protein